MNINEKINKLSEGQRRWFLKELYENLNYKTWYETNGLDWVNPDSEIAKEILYKKRYGSLGEFPIQTPTQAPPEPLSQQNAIYSE